MLGILRTAVLAAKNSVAPVHHCDRSYYIVHHCDQQRIQMIARILKFNALALNNFPTGQITNRSMFKWSLGHTKIQCTCIELFYEGRFDWIKDKKMRKIQCTCIKKMSEQTFTIKNLIKSFLAWWHRSSTTTVIRAHFIPYWTHALGFGCLVCNLVLLNPCTVFNISHLG